MKRTALCCALVLASVSVARADDPKPAPKLWVESKELDFGEVMHGKQVKVDVPIENRGTAILKIRQVKPSCDCTVAGFPKEIAPGQKGILKLAFDSTKRPAGYQSFRIAIYSNDPTQADLGGSCTLLSLRGEVRTLYRKAPHGAYFGEFIKGLKPVTKTILVTGIRGAARKHGFKATLAGKLPDYLQVKVVPLPANNKRKGVRIHVTLLPHAPLGSLMHWLELKTSVPVQPQFRVMVSALVNTRITGPPAVNFGKVSRAKGAERVLGIERRDGGKGIPVGRLVYDRTRFEVEQKPLGATRIELALKIKPDAPPGPFARYLDVLLTDPNQPMVRIPVYGRILPRVQVEPPVVLLPEALRASKAAGRLTVRIDGRGAIKSAQVTGAQVEARVDREDGVTRVWLFAKQDGAPSAGQLVLTTDVAGEERVVVPLHPR